MSRARQLAAQASLLLATLLGIGLYLPDSPPGRLIIPPWGKLSAHIAARIDSAPFSSPAMVAVRLANVDVQYPRRQRENETRAVTMTYSLEPIGGRPLVRLDVHLIVELSSSGFDIAPAGLQERARGAALPARLAWTVTPKGEGNPRVLLLKVEEDAGPRQVRQPGRGLTGGGRSPSATLNGRGVEPNAGGAYEMPVVVGNYWGVDRRVSTTMVAVLALIAWLLGRPLVESYLQRLIERWRKRSSPNT